MKTLLSVTAALAATAVAGSAMAADTANRGVNINGAMADTCTVASPTVVGSATNASLAGNVVSVTQLASDVDARLQPTTITLNLEVMCNNPGVLLIGEANGGLVRSGGAGPVVGGNFIRKIGYELEADWFGLALTGNERERGHNSLLPGSIIPINFITTAAARGPATVKFTIPTDNRPVVAGSYSTTVTVRAQSSL